MPNLWKKGGVKEISLKMRGDLQADLYGEE